MSREITEIIVHCTATKSGQEVTAQDIDRWHRAQGWEQIGYHYVVYLDGTIAVGRPEWKVGAHCFGHNANSIGVCYVGGLDYKGNPADTRTAAQKNSLIKLLNTLKKRFPKAKIHGHRDFSDKECPCFDATFEYALL